MWSSSPIAHEPPSFDYDAAAELFPPRRAGSSGLRGLTYKRFAFASEAIQFAIEKLPRTFLLGAYLEVGDERYGHQDIQRLYESADYPLGRTTAP
jgi:hypothetical protein